MSYHHSTAHWSTQRPQTAHPYSSTSAPRPTSAFSPTSRLSVMPVSRPASTFSRRFELTSSASSSSKRFGSRPTTASAVNVIDSKGNDSVIDRLADVVTNFTLKEFRDELRIEAQEEEKITNNTQRLDACEHRLNVFRNELQHFVQRESGALAGLIKSITNEYENVIRHLKINTGTESAQTVRTVLSKTEAELAKTFQECERRGSRIKELESSVGLLERGVHDTHEKYLAAQKELDELRLCVGNEAASVLPNTDVYDVRTFTRAVHTLVMEVKELREKVSVLTNDNMTLVEDYNTQCDELNTALDRANDVQSQNGALKAAIRIMKQKIESLEQSQSELEQMTKERDGLEFEVLLWHRKADHNYRLYQHTHSLLLASLQRRGLQSSTSDAVAKGSNFLESFGVDAVTPAYLRSKNRVKNLQFDVSMAVSLVAEIWEEKAVVDRSRDFPIPLGAFLAQYFLKKYGKSTMAMEYAYSLVDACERFGPVRSDLQLFHDVLRAQCPERVLETSQARIDAIRAGCARTEVEKPIGKKKGKVLRADLLPLFEEAFPLAPPEFLDRVCFVMVQSSDPKNIEEVVWQDLFDPVNGRMIAVLQNQTYFEYIEYWIAMQSHARRYVLENNLSVGAVPVTVVQSCLQTFEPKASRSEIMRRMTAGTNSTWELSECCDGEVLPTTPSAEAASPLQVTLNDFFVNLLRTYLCHPRGTPEGENTNNGGMSLPTSPTKVVA